MLHFCNRNRKPVRCVQVMYVHAAAGHRPPTSQLAALAAFSAARVAQFPPAKLATLLWAFATLSFSPPALLAQVRCLSVVTFVAPLS